MNILKLVNSSFCDILTLQISDQRDILQGFATFFMLVLSIYTGKLSSLNFTWNCGEFHVKKYSHEIHVKKYSCEIHLKFSDTWMSGEDFFSEVHMKKSSPEIRCISYAKTSLYEIYVKFRLGHFDCTASWFCFCDMKELSDGSGTVGGKCWLHY